MAFTPCNQLIHSIPLSLSLYKIIRIWGRANIMQSRNPIFGNLEPASKKKKWKEKDPKFYVTILYVLLNANVVVWHPLYSSIDGITGFSEEESQSVFSFMNSAIQLAKSGGGLVTIFLIGNYFPFFHDLTSCPCYVLYWGACLPVWCFSLFLFVRLGLGC